MSETMLEAKTPKEILACWETTVQLRPHLVKAEFVKRVQQQQQDEGYVLLCLVDGTCNSPDGKAMAILGYRILNKLWCGKEMYIDDFCTHESARRKGYGGKLMDWAKQIAAELKCDCVTLDSGYGRHDAHRVYLNKGFYLGSHHFHMDLH